jgi:hypothetical protein
MVAELVGHAIWKMMVSAKRKKMVSLFGFSI